MFMLCSNNILVALEMVGITGAKIASITFGSTVPKQVGWIFFAVISGFLFGLCFTMLV
jgi:hypothetical protein